MPYPPFIPSLRSMRRSLVTPSMLVLTPTGISDVSVPYYFGVRDKLRTTGVAVLSAARNGISVAGNDESFIHLFNVWATGYYHFLLEVAPKFFAFESDVRTSTVLIPRDAPGFIQEFLELFGFENRRIVDRCLYFPELRVITDPRAGEHEDGFVIPMRERVLASIDGAGEAPRQRVYVSRQRSGRRKIINDEEVAEFLGRFGFETYYLEDLSFADQVRLLSNCEVLVTLHGAAIANSVFMDKGTRVIEIFPKPANDRSVVNPCFQNLANTMNLKHEFFFCERADPSENYDFHRNDVVVRLDELRKLIDSPK